MSKLGANTNFSDFNVYTHRLTHRVLTKAISFYVKRGTLIFFTLQSPFDAYDRTRTGQHTRQ